MPSPENIYARAIPELTDFADSFYIASASLADSLVPEDAVSNSMKQ